MKVLKFGGTSVGTAESLRNVKNIVEACDTPVVVVVSALGGLTDRLIATAGKAAAGDESYRDEVKAMADRHFLIINEVVQPDLREATTEVVAALMEQLGRNYDGLYLLRDLPKRTLDVIVSFGERMSSVIVAAMISGATRFDSLRFIKTEKWYSKNIADQKLTTLLIREAFRNFSGVAIVPGFISTDRDTDEITNLGRGGSDFTAALIAAALDAVLLEIWTDVDGFMTADPRIIPEAKVMPEMTFTESMELCNFGAKVIYPPTIYPVFHKNIPIKILNTFNPSAPGTLIREKRADSSEDLKGVSAVKGTSVFSIRACKGEHADELHSRTLNAMARGGITVFLVNSDDDRQTISFAVSEADSENALANLRKEFAPELASSVLCIDARMENLATVALVGDGMQNRERLSPRILNTLQRVGIDVVAHSLRPSSTTLSYVVPLEDVNRTLRIIHSLVF